ncbi:MAG TPA: M28 family peptidase [bacterium]|nr:M28 family peptidase [bacterium]
MIDLEAVSQSELTTFNRTIAQWTRLSGTSDERAAAEYVARQLKAFGYATQLVVHDAYISLPGAATLRVTSPEARALSVITHSMGMPTPRGGLTAELVYAGKGGVDEHKRAGAAGKFALVEGRATPQLAVNATAAGVAGIVCISGRHAHEMCCSPVWGNPSRRTAEELPEVVLLSVHRADGEALRELCRAGRVDVHATAEVQTGWTTTPIVVADLTPGHAEAEDRFVLFSGHLDSWYVGAMDNGSANATMLEVARVLAPHRKRLRRGLRLAFWSGHSHGRYSSSAWYADTHWLELRARCLLHVNIDSVGAVDADDFGTNSMPQTAGVASWAVRRVAAAELDAHRVGRNSDQSFLGVGVPSIFGSISRQADGTLGWWWHTPHDTLDKIDPARLVRDAKIFVLALDRILTDPVVPLDYDAAATDLREQLALLAGAAGPSFDLTPAVAAASRLETLCRRLSRAGARGRNGGAPAAAINTCIHALGRSLVPATYTSAGRYAHDPALETVFLPGLQPAATLPSIGGDSDAGRFLRVDLVRARNAVTDAIHHACRSVEDCLASLAGPGKGAAGARPRRKPAPRRAAGSRPARATARRASGGSRRAARRARPQSRRASPGTRRRGTSA